MPLGEDRILVIKNGATMDDSLWFLEVGLLSYESNVKIFVLIWV